MEQIDSQAKTAIICCNKVKARLVYPGTIGKEHIALWGLQNSALMPDFITDTTKSEILWNQFAHLFGVIKMGADPDSLYSNIRWFGTTKTVRGHGGAVVELIGSGMPPLKEKKDDFHGEHLRRYPGGVNLTCEHHGEYEWDIFTAEHWDEGEEESDDADGEKRISPAERIADEILRGRGYSR